jgi:hypothetical protein
LPRLDGERVQRARFSLAAGRPYLGTGGAASIAELPVVGSSTAGGRMRLKIIIVNAAILSIVGLLSFVLLRASLDGALSNRSERRLDAERALRSANMQLELDGLRLERWLAGRAAEPGASRVFAGGTAQARSENASQEAQRLRDAANQSSALAALSIPIVLFLDARGIVLGRNDSSQMRGEDLGREYPSLLDAISRGQSSSQFWLNRQRSEQLLASYAPVRGEGGQVVGLLVAGTPLNDERLRLISQATSGQALALAVADGSGGIEWIADASSSSERSELDALRELPVSSRLAASLEGGLAIFDDDQAVYAVEQLRGYDARGVLLVAVLAGSLVPSIAGLLWPLLGVTLLGLLLVVMAGVSLGNYIAEPISEIEEGLLSVINGRASHRFDIEHPDLGGLVFRLNCLLNALMGVPETDADGRTSQPPGARYREADGPRGV